MVVSVMEGVQVTLRTSQSISHEKCKKPKPDIF